MKVITEAESWVILRKHAEHLHSPCGWILRCPATTTTKYIMCDICPANKYPGKDMTHDKAVEWWDKQEIKEAISRAALVKETRG